MSVEQDLQQIMSARYGKDVRQSIHDAIFDINEVAKRAEYDASTAPESAKAYAEAALASLQAAEDAQQAAEDAAAEAMSGTPAGYDDVVADVYSLKENTGTFLANPKSDIGRVLLDKIYGMSLQNGTPTPSVPIDIKSAKANLKCVGKNLIPMPFSSYGGKASGYEAQGIAWTYDSDGVITLNGTATGRADHALFNQNNKIFSSGGEYKIVVEWISGTYQNYRPSFVLERQTWPANAYDGQTGNCAPSTTVGQKSVSSKITIPDATNFRFWFVIYFTSGAVFNNYKVKVSIMPWDEDNTDYEPYKAQSVTTDLVLRAIEVTSTDDYNLVKDGKYYVADTLEKIDGGYQITRRIGEWVFDGSEDEIWTVGPSSANYDCFTPINDLKDPTSSSVVDDGLTNRFSLAVSRVDFYGNQISNYNVFCRLHSGTYNKQALAFRVQGITDASALRTWLASNNVVYISELETPTVETVTDANAIKLLSLKSYDEATYVAQTEDTEGVMVLEYGSTNFATKALSGYVEAESNSIRIGLLENA